ncbi:MAG: NAD(P)-binding domain-containing protein [Gammaproteobacteria bacterium]|nr:NAD(P)-binding domain-containing protein [Gammaproteobacteria bacterium]
MDGQKSACVIGAGSAGLIAAKELKEQGFLVKILDSNAEKGGIWSQLPWKSYTLTSSKWVTEYGCYPMPEHYPDFVTNNDMLEYLDSFAAHFELKDLIDYSVRVSAIQSNPDNSLNIVTNQGTYRDFDHVVVCTGLHGKPSIPEFDGLESFTGKVMHSANYHSPDEFSGKNVLCVGLGESGVGLVSELATVTDKLVVSSTGVAVAPRVVKGSQNPFDQMQFWQIGRYIIGYQEILTTGLSWIYRRIPRFLKKINFAVNIKFYSDYGIKFEQFEEWFPKAMIPHHFHVKFWAKPPQSSASGNLTRVDAPSDDLFYLIKTDKLIPKGAIKSFDANGVFFQNGDYEQVDTLIFNTGYKPGVCEIEFPDHWQYRHADLFKGCLHPELVNLAFVGMVRPTIGSIPAMAEMHARIVAAYFSRRIVLPSKASRLKIIEEDNAAQLAQCPTMNERFPHIYFFDQWMDQMAELLGARLTLADCHSTLDDIKTFFFGAPMPLRYRIKGIGKIDNAASVYKKRVNKIWGNGFGQWAMTSVLVHFLTPYVLSLAVLILSLTMLNLSFFTGLVLSICFVLLYRYVDFFRYLFEIGFARTISIAAGVFFIGKLKKQKPDYTNPIVFQTLEKP